MKWSAYWWGIVLVSETKEDAELLRTLASKLSKEPETTYDNGELKVEDTGERVKITLNR